MGRRDQRDRTPVPAWHPSSTVVPCFASTSDTAPRGRRRRWRPGSTACATRGIEAHALELPKRKAEDAVAAYEAQVPDEPGAVVGGHSFGGRVASLAVAGVRVAGAAERVHPYAGLVCLSYPMHAPGRPEAAEARSAHWPAIDIPALLLSGTSDPFARIDLLEAAMPMLRHGRLVTYPEPGPRAAAGPRGRARSDRVVHRRAAGPGARAFEGPA